MGQEHADLILLNYKSIDIQWNPIKPVTLGLDRVKGGEKNQREEMQRAKGGGRFNGTLGLRLENLVFILAFFFKCWPGWTSSIQSVSDFGNRNQTKLEIFYDFLIG